MIGYLISALSYLTCPLWTPPAWVKSGPNPTPSLAPHKATDDNSGSPQDPLGTLTDALWQPLKQVLGKQQICEQRQPTQLHRQLLQPVL